MTTEPTPEHVNQTEEILRKLGKMYEFHIYEGAGHGFFATDRPNYRPVQATDALDEGLRLLREISVLTRRRL